jgi:hypothetical protein
MAKEPIHLDENWIKRTSWDLPIKFPEFLSMSHTADPDKSARWLTEFLDRPAAQAMPDDLRKEALRYLAERKR